jgi:hypothetical protein
VQKNHGRLLCSHWVNASDCRDTPESSLLLFTRAILMTR